MTNKIPVTTPDSNLPTEAHGFLHDTEQSNIYFRMLHILRALTTWPLYSQRNRLYKLATLSQLRELKHPS